MKIYAAATAMAVLTPQFAHAAVQVGGCATGANYPTIGAAIAGVPTGGTIDICPGTYPEQLTINKSLKLIGVTSGNSSQVLIVPPTTGPNAGLANNASDFDNGGTPIAAQIAVIRTTSAVSVTISNLTVDAAGNTVGANNGCGSDVVGILYQNASGTISNNVVRNQYLNPFSGGEGLGGCQSGLAIFAQTSSPNSTSVTISNNIVQNYQKNGITVSDAGTTLNINSNTVLGMGPTAGAAENSIQVGYGASGSVTSNTAGDDIWAPDTFGDTGDAAAGILVYDSAGVQITSNIVHSTQYGIVVVGDGTLSANSPNVSSNTVADTYLYDAIDICGSNYGTVTSNTLRGSDESGIHIDSTCYVPSGAAGSGNKINDACAGILVGSGSTNNITGTTNSNEVNLTLAGDVCEAMPQARQESQSKPHHPRPFR
jgi:hypothetical protein